MMILLGLYLSSAFLMAIYLINVVLQRLKLIMTSDLHYLVLLELKLMIMLLDLDRCGCAISEVDDDVVWLGCGASRTKIDKDVGIILM